MKWMEIALKAEHMATETVADIFLGLGAGGVAIDDPREAGINSGGWDYTDLKTAKDEGFSLVRAWLPYDGALEAGLAELAAKLAELNERLPGAVRGAPQLSLIEEEDWANNWKKYFHPFRLGRRIVIKPPWEAYEEKAGNIVVHIDPGAAFGTGLHPSTALCAEKLEEVLRPGWTVFDIGAGSGILSIIAARLGAARVTAVDIDRLAVDVARENVRLNDLCDIITVKDGDLLSGVTGRADLITANIVADVIITLLPAAADRLRPGGLLLAGGIIEERADEIKAAARISGFQPAALVKRAGWVLWVLNKE